MKFEEVFDNYTDAALRADAEARAAIAEFKRNIPGRIMQMQFDGSRSNKQGIVDGQKVYKLGLDLSTSAAFIEFYEDRSQGQPTMAIRATRNKRRIDITGWRIDKQLHVRFEASGGAVNKTVRIS
ncbi:MAG: hypothetical protein NC184_03105 [Roseburia sp.]|nr:hypothetical protein [Roseburia sp.]